MHGYYLICTADLRRWEVSTRDVSTFLESLESPDLDLIQGTLSTRRSYVQVNDFEHDSLASDDCDVIAKELTKTICQAYEEKDEDLKEKVLEWTITLRKAYGSMDHDRLVWSREIYENQKS